MRESSPTEEKAHAADELIGRVATKRSSAPSCSLVVVAGRIGWRSEMTNSPR
jgi:hypothetical protein